MSGNGFRGREPVLAFSAALEAGTGLCLMLVPTLVVRLLLGEDAAGAANVVARTFGIALLALGIACWPGGTRPKAYSPAPLRGMVMYNALIAAYLAYLGTVGQLAGTLLWPAVALHAAVAILLTKDALRGPLRT